MSAWSGVAISILLLGTAACGSGVPSASPPAAQTQAASAGPAAPPTAAATARPAATPRTGVFPNPDGSTFVGLPGTFGFAQPGDDAIWGVLGHGRVDRDIIRIDPKTFELETLVAGLPILPQPVAPVETNGFIWLSSDDKGIVTQYDADTGELVREIEVGLFPIEPVVAYGDVWTLNHHGDSVTRIDVDTGKTRSIELPGAAPLQLTAVADDLMLVNGASPTTFVVDPQRMELLGSYQPTGCYEATGWVASAFDGQLWRKRCNVDEVAILDPRTGKLVDSFAAPIHASLKPLVVDGIWWFPTKDHNRRGTFGLAGLDPTSRTIVGAWEMQPEIKEGWVFAAFGAWWRWGDEGFVHVPADTLRAAMQ